MVYQGIKIEVNNHRLTVEYVNQASTHISQLDLSDKTDYAEELGQMNKHFQAIAMDVADRLRNLEMMELKWQEYDKGVTALLDWFADQEKRIAKFKKIGPEVSVQQNLKECNVSFVNFTLLDY